MSRNIQVPTKNTSLSGAMGNTENGKLLFTAYHNHPFAFLLSGNRLIAAQALSEQESAIGAIYMGKVRKVAKNLDAYFVEIANGEICFLPMKEVNAPTLLKVGQELPVQIMREAQKTKQASVTARISLSNDYAVISLGAKKIGFSNKLSEDRREEVRDWLRSAGYLNQKRHFSYTPIENVSGNQACPDCGIIIRTRAQDCTREELLSGIAQLTGELLHLLQQAEHRACFSCIRKAPAAYEEILDRMAYPYEYEEIVTDDPILYAALTSAPTPGIKIRLYEDPDLSLTKLYSLEAKMETALERRVWLKSGGYLIIDHTEALTVIDVNSGKYDARRPSEDTAWLINQEAAEEIALQLRLRNLSGMILVDFINMKDEKKNEELLQMMRNQVRHDKVKTVVHDMTELGLVELTRKKQYKTLREQVRGIGIRFYDSIDK